MNTARFSFCHDKYLRLNDPYWRFYIMRNLFSLAAEMLFLFVFLWSFTIVIVTVSYYTKLAKSPFMANLG